MTSFDENGKYIKTNWKAGDKITATKLNKIEESIEAVNDNDISRHVEADARLDALEAKDVAHDKEFTNVKNLIEDAKSAAELGDYEINSRMQFLEQEFNDGIEEVHNVAETMEERVSQAKDEMTAQVDQGKADMKAEVEQFETDINADMTTHKNEVNEELESVNSQLVHVENNKSDIKVELLDTLACNNTLFKLNNHTNYPILQGGCLSDDGLYYYCCSITSGGGAERGIIDKYSIGSISNFNTWEHVATSSEINTSHGNDMTYFNGEIYLTNTNVNPNEIIVINPDTLIVIRTIIMEYGATSITYNKKLNQFITRRKNEWNTFDFYDINFNHVKSSTAGSVTFDTVQGMDSDDSYIYSPCSDVSFGNSVVVHDLKGNFVKRLGANTMSEIEHMMNFNGYFITGYYKNGSNFLAISTLRTDKRMTASRYVLNQGRNTVLADSTQVFNGTINLKFSRKYYSHLSFNMTVDGVDVETKILDITDTQETTSRILNSFRMTGSGQVIFYRSLLVIRETSLEITPVVFHQVNPDGMRIVKTYNNNPSEFNKTNSISISNVCGQILCSYRMTE